jgi:NADH-quinone oxidoreductase subunit L
MISLSDMIPWLCWIFPTSGAVASLALARVSRRVRDWTVILLTSLGTLMALLMLPDLLTYSYIDKQFFWFVLPGGISLDLGMLVDPLSIILALVVSFLGLLIMIYSLKYMEHDSTGITRYWFFMSLFIGSMLLLVLADNFILMYVGWKIVGLCSFGLIGYYYSDEREHWIGGPAPFPFQKPSRNGLKGLLVTSFGDVALLGGIIIMYLYSGTFNFVQLYQTAGIWLAQMAKDPGILALTSILILAGIFAKSAQFPFHEWLPEAMSGPTPVSALIHAATMVKAGVYLVARILPIFFFACWVAVPSYPEALTFFIATAIVGGFTAFMAATQAMVAKELKKALAYSTMSVIGYMMLALGAAGLSASTMVGGMSAAIFQLINHGLFKVVLFLGAGVIIYASKSIYLSEMKLSRAKMGFTWVCMWIAGLALIGVPPFSGFWSKDDILITCWQSGQYALFAVALATIMLTTFYVIRFMGMIFYGHENGDSEGDGSVRQELAGGKGRGGREASWLMLAPYGILAALTVAIGLVGPLVSGFLSTAFSNYFAGFPTLAAAVNNGASASSGASTILGVPSLELWVGVASVLMVAIGALPAYRIYIAHRTDPASLMESHASLRSLHSFFWNRWYIDAFYNRVFVEGTLSFSMLIVRFIENPLDRALNVGIPSLFRYANRGLRKMQTGILSVNMLLFIAFLAVILLLLWLGRLI